MHLLIDADSLLYKAGFVVNEPGQEDLACWQLDGLIKTILEETSPETYQLYLTGKDNFRYKVYQQYKANRVGTPRPIHLKTMTEHMIDKWGASVSQGKEADDDVGIAQCTALDETAIAHIDKDINMIPGRHFNYSRLEWYDVSTEEAIRHFFWQLIMGDKGDNIPGFDGLMRQKVPKKLEWAVNVLYEAEDTDEMLTHLFSMYNSDWQRLDLSAQCLWIWRKQDDNWTEWLNPDLINELKEESVSIMADYGQPVDLTPLSPPFFGQEADDGSPSMNV